MRLDVLVLPGELAIPRHPELAAVVIDVVRATTCIVTAFQHGCRSILPVADIEEARNALAAMPGALLAGEQGGERIPGFPLGNSPREFNRETVEGREVIMTTSNGTRALRAAGPGRTVAIGAFLNRAAVGGWLEARREDCLLVCSGSEGGFSLEDAVCAGAVVDRAVDLSPELTLGDGAKACRILWERHAPDLPGLLREAAWGRRIVDLGLEADLEYCARLDVTRVVPVMAGDRVLPGESRR
jgi:2-phosphosulfolactate phosphatase